jgi:hypothetical protein
MDKPGQLWNQCINFQMCLGPKHLPLLGCPHYSEGHGHPDRTPDASEPAGKVSNHFFKIHNRVKKLSRPDPLIQRLSYFFAAFGHGGDALFRRESCSNKLDSMSVRPHELVEL